MKPKRKARVRKPGILVVSPAKMGLKAYVTRSWAEVILIDPLPSDPNATGLGVVEAKRLHSWLGQYIAWAEQQKEKRK